MSKIPQIIVTYSPAVNRVIVSGIWRQEFHLKTLDFAGANQFLGELKEQAQGICDEQTSEDLASLVESLEFAIGQLKQNR